MLRVVADEMGLSIGESEGAVGSSQASKIKSVRSQLSLEAHNPAFVRASYVSHRLGTPNFALLRDGADLQR